MIYEPRIAAIDPVELAIASGAQKARRFAAPIPAVATPFLLTAQLKRGLGVGRGMGCGCDGGMAAGMIPPDYGTLRGYVSSADMVEHEGLGAWGSSSYSCPTTYSQANLGVPSAGSGMTSMLQAVANGARFIPGVGTIGATSIQTAIQAINQFEQWFNIGSGRREADLIVPVQNQLMAHLGTITNQFLTGTNPSVSDLQGMYRDVWASAVAFQEFVLMCTFTDRRASGQALNTVMPYIDGSCGYPVPVGQTASPTQHNCISWGDGTLGGVGQDGMLGALARAISRFGGAAPSLPDLHNSANQGLPSSGIGGIGGGVLPATIFGISTPLLLVGGIALFLVLRK